MDREGMVMISKTSTGGGGPKCGRWNPTPEQVRVLTDLFRSGLRTPTTDQIQKISSHLSSFGKIESKNVFYWFQNHKARERHHCKKRRRQTPPSTSSSTTTTTSSSSSSSPPPRPDLHNTPTVRSREAEPAVTSTVFGTDQFGGGGREVETLELFPLSSHGELLMTPRNDHRETTACRCGGKDFLLDLRLSF